MEAQTIKKKPFFFLKLVISVSTSETGTCHPPGKARVNTTAEAGLIFEISGD